ncbi:MAG: HAMP domain-containing protein [Clostridia bacterium]|nr:MAG: HAMP domain-containing protein [Clostridia bacterium]
MKRRQWLRLLFNLAGVKAKIMGIALALVFLLASCLIWQAQAIYAGTMRANLISGGYSLAAYVAARSEGLILTANIYALHELIADAKKNNEDLRYVFVTDARGRLLVDTFADGLPKGLLSFNPWSPGQPYSLRTFRSEEGIIHDIAYPILEGDGGVLHLGLSEARLDHAVASLKRRLWLITLLVSALGVSMAYALANMLTRPLQELVLATEKIAGGELHWRVPLDWLRDEFGRLGAAFNSMLDSLQQADAEKQRLAEVRTHLLQKVITAQEEERKRVARELHDQTAQALTTLNLGLSSLATGSESEEAARRIAALKATAYRAMEEIKALSYRLRPSALDDLGLGAAVERYVQDCSRQWGKEIGWHISGLDGRLPGEIEIIAYRIIQEALNNAARHARAENISVVLEKREDQLLAIIEDDGIGFEVERTVEAGPDAALGLAGMQERAELVGGTLQIESAPGAGTTVYLRVPLA